MYQRSASPGGRPATPMFLHQRIYTSPEITSPHTVKRRSTRISSGSGSDYVIGNRESVSSNCEMVSTFYRAIHYHLNLPVRPQAERSNKALRRNSPVWFGSPYKHRQTSSSPLRVPSNPTGSPSKLRSTDDSTIYPGSAALAKSSHLRSRTGTSYFGSWREESTDIPRIESNETLRANSQSGTSGLLAPRAPYRSSPSSDDQLDDASVSAAYLNSPQDGWCSDESSTSSSPNSQEYSEESFYSSSRGDAESIEVSGSVDITVDDVTRAIQAKALEPQYYEDVVDNVPSSPSQEPASGGSSTWEFEQYAESTSTLDKRRSSNYLSGEFAASWIVSSCMLMMMSVSLARPIGSVPETCTPVIVRGSFDESPLDNTIPSRSIRTDAGGPASAPALQTTFARNRSASADLELNSWLGGRRRSFPSIEALKLLFERDDQAKKPAHETESQQVRPRSFGTCIEGKRWMRWRAGLTSRCLTAKPSVTSSRHHRITLFLPRARLATLLNPRRTSAWSPPRPEASSHLYPT